MTTTTSTAGSKQTKSIGGGFAQNPLGLPLLLDRVDDEYGDLLSAVQERIEQGVLPVMQQNQKLQHQIDQLAKPVRQGAPFFAVNGPLVGAEEDRRGFQLYRAYGRMAKSPYCDDQNCKVEMAMHEKLQRFFVEQNGFEMGGVGQSMLVPYGSSLLPDAFADEVGQLMQQGIRGAELNELQHHAGQSYGADVRQALSQFDTVGLGIFTDASVSGEMFDLVRNREVFSRVGATQLTLPPNGRLKFSRATGDTTAYWVGEKSEITTSEPTTGSLELAAKKLAARVILPNELLRFGTPSVEAFLRMGMARVIAIAADLAMLESLGSSTKVRGILSYPNIINYTAGTVATDGNTFAPEDPAGMLADVEEANHDPEMDGFAFVMRPKMWKNIRVRRAGALDTNDAVDESVGQWLFDINRAAIQNGQPMMLEGHQVAKSSQVSNTREKGASTDLTYILGGIFRHWLIANAGVMEFATATQGDTTFANDQTQVRAIRHVDAGPRYEDAFVLCDSIDLDLPA